MFEQVGYKVAVDNAIDIVKEKADEITLFNDEDGVAVFLNKLLENYWVKEMDYVFGDILGCGKILPLSNVSSKTYN